MHIRATFTLYYTVSRNMPLFHTGSGRGSIIQITITESGTAKGPAVLRGQDWIHWMKYASIDFLKVRVFSQCLFIVLCLFYTYYSIYLFGWCFTPYPEILHSYNGSQHYRGKKPRSYAGSCKTFHLLCVNFYVIRGVWINTFDGVNVRIRCIVFSYDNIIAFSNII